MSNPNIVVEITDPTEPHCFRLLLNPKGHEPWCPAALEGDTPCTCQAEGKGARIEIMLHARALVDLIYKCNVALCDWQFETTQRLVELSGRRILTPDEYHEAVASGRKP